MIRTALVASLLLAPGACSRGSTTAHLDGSIPVDGPPRDTTAMIDAGPDGSEPFAHTITLDGTDDFTAAETFVTTSAGYDARITWDAQNLYIGYAGPDLDPAALDSASKWLFIALDLDPGAATGAASSLTYNTQRSMFPPGFGAERYLRWKCDATFVTLEEHQPGDTWMTSATAPPFARSGSFVELAIPRSALGTATTIGIVTWMINEKPTFEGTFAGLYADNFVDGYHATLPLSKYLRADLTSTRAPNDPENQAP